MQKHSNKQLGLVEIRPTPVSENKERKKEKQTNVMKIATV